MKGTLIVVALAGVLGMCAQSCERPHGQYDTPSTSRYMHDYDELNIVKAERIEDSNIYYIDAINAQFAKSLIAFKREHPELHIVIIVPTCNYGSHSCNIGNLIVCEKN